MRKLEEGGGRRRKSPLRHMQLTGHMLCVGDEHAVCMYHVKTSFNPLDIYTSVSTALLY